MALNNNLTDSITDTNAGLSSNKSLIFPKSPGNGIKIDNVAPAFGWRDIIGQLYVRGAGAQDPTWTTYNGVIYQYRFGALNDEVTMGFHLPHDYVPGTDIHAHVHWSLNVGLIAETVGWQFTSVYAKGFDQEAFTATPLVTSVTQASSTTQYQHMIAETVISSAAGSATLFANTLFEVDGFFIIRVKLLSLTGGSTYPFVHSIDLHYQSSNIATKNKAPSFYD